MPHRKFQPPAGFAQFGLSMPILHAIEKAGFKEPSEIQARLIPLVMAGKDVLGQARTGTGKTAAFGLPMLHMLEPDRRLQALVLVPTRELAVQVAAELRRLGEGTGLHVVPVYGGQKIKHQLHLLGRRPHIVVGTPGRVMDFLGRGTLQLNEITFVVLDEVDRMLDIGFRDDIRHILSQVTHPHQTVLVSATLNDEIKSLARRYMTDPVEVNVSRDELTVEHVTQVYMTVDRWDKFNLLSMVLKRERPKLAIIFCNTKHGARKLAKRLHEVGENAKEIHGDLVQQKRERVMEKFRKHNLHLLVATDLAARGIDVHGISHIINYDTPADPHLYVHRIGRTARMGSFGKAIMFVTREEGKQLTEIESLINKQIVEEKVEGFVPRPPPPDYYAPSAPSQPAASRYAAPVFNSPAAAEGAPVAARAKSLGAKFKPARRRRRL